MIKNIIQVFFHNFNIIIKSGVQQKNNLERLIDMEVSKIIGKQKTFF